MRSHTLAITSLLMATTIMAQHTIRIEIKTLPAHHAEGAKLYLAGSFNGWNSQDSSHRFGKDAKGNYFIVFELPKGEYEFKVTRGGWDKVECKLDGSSVDNHQLKVTGDESILLDIEEWADRVPQKVKSSTATKNVHIVDTAFFIPQLKRTRRVWIYLPNNYEKSNQHYPVLYMPDGQNVFDEATAFSGEWGIDEYLDSLKSKECIVVAVDNGDATRMTEYNPYEHPRFGKGEGNKTAEFFVQTLKPFVDKHYRTLSHKSNTFIAGSSMGGFISFFTLLKYPAVFGGAGIFSPSFHIAREIYTDILKKGKSVNSRIYFFCGEQEDERMKDDLLKAVNAMKSVSPATIELVIRNDSKHNEASWRQEFPLFYQWLRR